MLLNLNDFYDEPLQSRIVRQIRAKILSGELDAGTPVPSIRSPAHDSHVSVITVQRAFETLQRQNMLYSRRGKGFFVADFAKADKKSIAESNLRDNLVLPLKNGPG